MDIKHVSFLFAILSILGLGCDGKPARPDVFQNKLTCAEKGRQFMNELRQERAQISLSNERFAYDPTRNTCLVHYEALTDSAFHHVILDLTSNQQLYSFSSWFNGDVRKIVEESCKAEALKANPCLSLDEFNAKRDDLFKP